MNRRSGYISKKIDGTIRHFYFSINAWILFCEIHDLELSEMGKFLSDPKKQLVASRDLLYCSAVAYCREFETEENFNRYTAGSWYENLSEKDYKDIEKVMLECSFLKGKKKR